MQFCVDYRDRVNKLLLVAPAGLPYRQSLSGRIFNLPGVGEFLLGLNTNFIRAKLLADLWIHNRNLVNDSYVENVTRFQKIRGSTGAMLAILRQQFFDKLAGAIDRLARMDVPTLLVWGREDKLLPLPVGQALQRKLAGARLEILDRAGHVPNYERADAFNRLALEFLPE
jgi:pimeloyl-ACP methyl ester carboxylesterase